MTMLRPFGQTGLQVSPLGLGTSHIASLTNPHSPRAMARLLDQAYDQGIRMFDTADIYGQGDAERLLARVAQREGVVICTKAGLGVGKTQTLVRLAKPVLRPMLARSRGLRATTSATRQAKERNELAIPALRARLEASLRRIRRDHVDIFLLHSPPLSALADGRLYDFLDTLREAGLARVTGVSVQRLDDLGPVVTDGRVSAVQVPLWPSRLHQAAPDLTAAQAAGLGIIAREVLTDAPDPADALTAMLSEPRVPVSLVGTTSTQHLAANAALMMDHARNAAT